MNPETHALLTLFLKGDVCRCVVSYEYSEVPESDDCERSHPEIDFFREPEYLAYWKSKLGEYSDWSIVEVQHVDEVLS